MGLGTRCGRPAKGEVATRLPTRSRLRSPRALPPRGAPARPLLIRRFADRLAAAQTPASTSTASRAPSATRNQSGMAHTVRSFSIDLAILIPGVGHDEPHASGADGRTLKAQRALLHEHRRCVHRRVSQHRRRAALVLRAIEDDEAGIDALVDVALIAHGERVGGGRADDERGHHEGCTSTFSTISPSRVSVYERRGER